MTQEPTMLFERFEVEGLAHYSYAVGCKDAGCIAIVDPERNVDRYLAFAQELGVEITHVLETHIHADYASGARELAEQTGATLHVSAYDEGETYEVAFPHADCRHGDVIEIGSVRIEARHTPGHTPEHLAFLVSAGPVAPTNRPVLMLSGDFLFVGALGRPDLLGEEAKLDLARQLHGSVRALADLDDDLHVYPAHGAGSMCGAGMGGQPSTTLAAERATNPYLDPSLTESAFVEMILGNVPPFPPYYLRMKALNSRGPALLSELPPLQAIAPVPFRAMNDGGACVIDLRRQTAFGAGHIPRSFGIGLQPSLATWAAWVVPPDCPLLLVSEGEHDRAAAEHARQWLVRVGLDHVVGYLDGGIEAWGAEGLPMQTTEVLPPADVHARIAAGEGIRLLDVRSDAEWDAGHAEGAIHIMGGVLPERLDEIPDRAAPIAVMCGGGYRSVVAASVLERGGFTNIIDVQGGMASWRQAGLPVVRDETPVARS